MSQSTHDHIRLLTVCEICGVVDGREVTLSCLEYDISAEDLGAYDHAVRNDHIVGEIRTDYIDDDWVRERLEDGDHTVLDYPDDLHWRPDEVKL